MGQCQQTVTHKVYETNRPSSPAYLQYNVTSHFIKGNLTVLNENKGEKNGPTPAYRHFAGKPEVLVSRPAVFQEDNCPSRPRLLTARS